MGMTFEPPDINVGQYAFTPVSDSVIRYGLGAVKGTGQLAIDAIEQERESGGEFKSLFDFCARIDRTRVNKRTVEALIKAGAFDLLSQDRAPLLVSVSTAFEYAQTKDNNANQTGLFDLGEAHGSMMQ